MSSLVCDCANQEAFGVSLDVCWMHKGTFWDPPAELFCCLAVRQVLVEAEQPERTRTMTLLQAICFTIMLSSSLLFSNVDHLAKPLPILFNARGTLSCNAPLIRVNMFKVSRTCFMHIQEVKKPDRMGGDCCGGSSQVAVEHKMNDVHLQPLPNTAPIAATPKQTHEECAKELEGFIKKRINLFEQYLARENVVVSSWIVHILQHFICKTRQLATFTSLPVQKACCFGVSNCY